MCGNGENKSYAELEESQKKLQEQYDVESNRMNELKDQKMLLSNAKKALDQLAKDWKAKKNTLTKQFDKNSDWRGEEFDVYALAGDEIIKACHGHSDSYWKQLDTARDAINSQLTVVENQIMDKGTLLSDIWNDLNTLGTKIENWVN